MKNNVFFLPDAGFQKLLSSVIRREAGSLPRGFSQSISRATLSHDRNLQSIPGFLMSHYEKSKTPGLTQGLAGTKYWSRFTCQKMVSVGRYLYSSGSMSALLIN